MKGRKDVKMAEKRMDGKCLFRFLFFKKFIFRNSKHVCSRKKKINLK